MGAGEGDAAVLARVRAYPAVAGPAGAPSAVDPPGIEAGASTVDPSRLAAALAAVEAGRAVALLAYGANRSAAVLRAKLGAASRGLVVIPGALRGFDVVYSAHVSPYGAVPATLQRSPGTEVDVAVLVCAASAAAALDTTEPNYVRVELGAEGLALPGAARPASIQAYLSRHGCLTLDGREVALAAVPARRRRLAALTEAAVLERVHALLDPEREHDAWVLEGVRDASAQRERTRRLRAWAVAGPADGRDDAGESV